MTRVKTKRGGVSCGVCGKHHDHSESLCYRMNEAAIRSKLRPKVKSIEEVYEGGKIRAEFLATDMEGKLLTRQRRLAKHALAQLETDDYKIPSNVVVFLEQGFVWNQIAVEKPWAVYVLIDGRRKRKRFNNLRDAILFHRSMSKKNPNCGIVSLCHAYELPIKWMAKKDKLPRRFKWCPHCATFRVFKKTDPPEKFFAMVKRWNDTKGQYEYVDRELWLTECQLCGHNSRSYVYRRANQPYEVRRIKKGVRRVKARGNTKAISTSRQRTATRRRR